MVTLSKEEKKQKREAEHEKLRKINSLALGRVANFEYIDEASKMEEEIQEPIAEEKVQPQIQKDEGKRSRKQMVSVEDDDLAGLEDVSSDADDNYEAELSDGENFSWNYTFDNAELLPLMEGEGRAFRVLGFNQSKRAQFVQILMRFGVGDFDWVEFTSRLKQKSYEEIKLWNIGENHTTSHGFQPKIKSLQPPSTVLTLSTPGRSSYGYTIRDQTTPFGARFFQSITLPPYFFGDLTVKFVAALKVPVKVDFIEKQSKKVSKVHPLFTLFERNSRKKKATAKSEFSRYMQYLNEGGKKMDESEPVLDVEPISVSNESGLKPTLSMSIETLAGFSAGHPKLHRSICSGKICDKSDVCHILSLDSIMDPKASDIFEPSYWTIFGCHNDGNPALAAVSVMEGRPEVIFQILMSFVSSRSQWYFCFQKGSVIEKIDGSINLNPSIHDSIGVFSPVNFRPQYLVQESYGGKYGISVGKGNHNGTNLHHDAIEPFCLPPTKGFIRGIKSLFAFLASYFHFFLFIILE
ncbi:hypothetical protein L2E82_49427 [Cichorium intybus]|uniref:Uncharacterized protein n=1 Tax=Cichorium intybus TaxID=13427 RepID=A0ACB8YZN0_CICIN|nr:hypothetical protein L2E82_49427 [Cichorium intybus]